MEETLPQQNTGTDSDLPQASEEQPQGSATPRQSADDLQQGSEPVQQKPTQFPQMKQRTPAHSIPVRVAVRMFEDAGVPRSPHTITNWCNPNTESIARLDCWQDPKVRSYYITHESIEEVIQEEQKRGRYGNLQQPSDGGAATQQQSAEEGEKTAEEMQQSSEDKPD